MARARQRPRSRPEQRPSHYVIKRGRGFWQPTKRMQALGFSSVPCGLDGPQARAIAESWNVMWDAVRKQHLPLSRRQQQPMYQAITALSCNLAERLESEFERTGSPTRVPTVPGRVPIRVQTRRREYLSAQSLKWLGAPIRYLARAIRAVPSLSATSKTSLCGYWGRFQRRGTAGPRV
jgi:hypothetical protein